jgi:uncharacterized protein (DUF2342 family)
LDISKFNLLQKLDAFYVEFRQMIVNSGGALMPDDVIDLSIERLVDAGVWNQKNVDTFKRMTTSSARKGEAFTTLTQGNNEAKAIVDSVIEELGYNASMENETKTKRGRPKKESA